MPPVMPSFARRLICMMLAMATMCLLPWRQPLAATSRIVGEVREAATQRLLYTEIHEQTLSVDGAVQSGVTVYQTPDGREMARKVLDYRAHRTVPLYRMDIPAMRYAEGISQIASKARAYKVDQGQQSSQRLVLGEGLVAADAGFNQLLQDQLTRLSAGETVHFHLLVPGRLDRYRFRAVMRKQWSEGGRTLARIRVEPDSLLRWLVDAIELVYDTRTRQLRRYEGVSNILDPATGKVYPRVQIVYSETPAGDPMASATRAPVPAP